MNVVFTPQTFVLSPDGKIVHSQTGYNTGSEEEIFKALKKLPKPKKKWQQRLRHERGTADTERATDKWSAAFFTIAQMRTADGSGQPRCGVAAIYEESDR